jgi:hypothetical protein
VVIRVRRQTVGEIDASAIEKLAAGRDSYEHRRVTVFGDADGRLMLYLRFRPPIGISVFSDSSRLALTGTFHTSW